jgi:hypothetical protein
MKITNFKPVLAAVLSASALLVAGCVPTLTGETEPAWPFSGDGVITEGYERSVDQVVSATRWVLDHEGHMLVDNSVDHSFKAKINERTVHAKVTKLDDKVTQLKIQARTSLGSDTDLAHELDKKIALQLTVTH